MGQTVAAVIALVVGYLMGSIPIGYIICCRRYGVNPLLIGPSFSIGETNCRRALEQVLSTREAKKRAFTIQLLDQAKAGIPMAIGRFAFDLDSSGLALLGVGLILGHCYSLYLKGKGGKGVASTMGIGLVVYWPAAILSYVIWWAFKSAMAQKTKEATALASIFSAVSLACYTNGFISDPWLEGLMVFLVLHIVFAHRANLIRYSQEGR